MSNEEPITPVRVYEMGEEGLWHPVSDSGKVYTNMRYDAENVLSLKPGVRVSIWAPTDVVPDPPTPIEQRLARAIEALEAVIEAESPGDMYDIAKSALEKL